jgi:hypothetical protein
MVTSVNHGKSLFQTVKNVLTKNNQFIPQLEPQWKHTANRQPHLVGSLAAL